MRAVIYGRDSGDGQREASIEDQVRTCRAWVERDGADLVATYAGHAVSCQIRMRPGYRKLLEDASSGKFDVVVAEALDRLSREQEGVAVGISDGYRRARGTTPEATSSAAPARTC